MIKEIKKHKDKLYFIFRVLVGFLFFQHGAQKLFGWFGAQGTVPLFTLFGLAGLIELVGGLLILIGLFTKIVASITALEMLVAYFMAHASKGLIPIINGGELSLLYLAAFLVIVRYGGKVWAVENILIKKK